MTSILTSITIGCIVIGLLLGLLRGMNRSILRLVLILACAVAAFFLMETFTDMILSIEVEGGISLRDSILASFSEGAEMPESIKTLTITLIEIIIGLILFVVSFLLLQLISWMIIFPIFKIFIRPGAKKRRLLGMIVGAIQGAVIAFVFCAPITGLARDVYRLSEIEIEGQKVIPEEVNLANFKDSSSYKFYDSTGHWFYEILTTKHMDDGHDLSISDTVDVVVVASDVVKETTTLTESLHKVNSQETTVTEKVSGLKDVGESLINIGSSVNNLSDGGKEIMQTVITDVVAMVSGSSEENLPPEIKDTIENINLNDFSLESTGEAIKNVSTYIEKTNEGFENYGQEVTQEEVNSIVNGVADNSFIINVITGGAETPEEVPTLIEVKEEDVEKFETAISQADKLSDDEKEMLKKLLGLA